MKQGTPRLALLLLFVSVAVATAACLAPPSVDPSSPLTVLGTLDATPDTVVEARIIVSRGKHVVEATVPVERNEFQGSVQVPVGQWELTVYLVDAEGIVRFQSKPQTIQVAYGTPQAVELVLRPAASTVHITIDLEGYIFRNQALRARIYFNDQMHELIRQAADAPFEATFEISPGSYEFKIELYTESFHAGNRLGVGVWRVIDVDENESVSLVWRPETEDLVISGHVETLLPPPAWVSATGAGPEVEISWAPVDHWNLAGYLVLAQTSPLERFEVLTPTPLETTSCVHTLDMDELPPEVKYVVAAVTRHGLVGYYSAPEIWTP